MILYFILVFQFFFLFFLTRQKLLGKKEFFLTFSFFFLFPIPTFFISLNFFFRLKFSLNSMKSSKKRLQRKLSFLFSYVCVLFSFFRTISIFFYENCSFLREKYCNLNFLFFLPSSQFLSVAVEKEERN